MFIVQGRLPSIVIQYVTVVAASPGAPACPVSYLSVSLAKSWTSNRPSSPPETTIPETRPGGWNWTPPVAGNRSDVLLPSIIGQHTCNSHPLTDTPAKHIAHNQHSTAHLVFLQHMNTVDVISNLQWSRLNIYKDIVARGRWGGNEARGGGLGKWGSVCPMLKRGRIGMRKSG